MHARIATQQALGFEWTSQVRVDLKKCSRNRELCRAGLAHNAAAAGVNKQVVCINRLGILQRFQYHILQRHRREIVFEGPAIDIDFSVALHHEIVSSAQLKLVLENSWDIQTFENEDAPFSRLRIVVKRSHGRDIALRCPDGAARRPYLLGAH